MPVVFATRKKSNDPCLSVNTNDGVYFCHNCNISGGVDTNSQNKAPYKPFKAIKQQNATPYTPTELKEISGNAIAFMRERGISEETLRSEGIKIASKWMPQVQREQNVIAFPFIKNNMRVATKYRDNKKNMSQDKGGEKCFYRFDEMKKGKKIYITEGEIDALTLVQCGFSDGVTSVPDGAPNPTANNLDKKFDYFTEEAMKIFDDAEEIYPA